MCDQQTSLTNRNVKKHIRSFSQKTFAGLRDKRVVSFGGFGFKGPGIVSLSLTGALGKNRATVLVGSSTFQRP